MDISTKELSDKIKDILKDADLEKITSKLVRCQLEQHFQQSLTSRRNEIDEIIMSTLNPPAEEEKADSDSSDDLSSDELSPSEFEPRRPAKRSKGSRSGAKHGTSRSKSSKSTPLTDEELARQLQASENGMRVRQRVNMSTLPWYARKGAAKKRKSDENGDAPTKKEPRGKLCIMSEPLAELLGESQMTRHNIVKRLWEIAKERDLFDPTNRRFIICDEDFKRVFNRNRIRMFTIMKHVNTIIKDIDDII